MGNRPNACVAYTRAPTAGGWGTHTKSVVLAPGKEAGKKPTTRLDYLMAQILC